MTELQKRRISASKIIADIRSGMSEAGLMEKYGLSQNSLNKTLSKLVDSGHLLESEIPQRQARETSPVVEPEKKVQLRCPSCDAEWTEDVDECPFCGVVIKKFMASRRIERDLETSSEDSGEKNWFSVIVSILICASIGIGLIWWSRHQAKETISYRSHGKQRSRRPGVTCFFREEFPTNSFRTGTAFSHRRRGRACTPIFWGNSPPNGT